MVDCRKLWDMSMTRLALFLAACVFVVAKFEGKYQVVVDTGTTDYSLVTVAKYHDSSIAEDVAYALNEAHEKRTQKPLGVIYGIEVGKPNDIPEQYQFKGTRFMPCSDGIPPNSSTLELNERDHSVLEKRQ